MVLQSFFVSLTFNMYLCHDFYLAKKMTTTTVIVLTVAISYVCFRNGSAFNRLSLRPYDIIHKREWYRLLSHGFVHADMMHLLFNMITFYSFGTYVESVFTGIFGNEIQYMGLYFGGMIFASLYNVIKRRNDAFFCSVGASGAISAILFTSMLLNPWGKILLFFVLPVPGILMGPLFLVYCRYMAHHGTDNIDHNAHFYGALFGVIYPVLLKSEMFGHFVEMLLHK